MLDIFQTSLNLLTMQFVRKGENNVMSVGRAGKCRRGSETLN